MLRYAITDRIRLADDERTRQSALLAQAARLASKGVDFLHLREKDLSTAELANLARDLLATLRNHSKDPTRARPKLLINSRADIAVATRAEGVHLTSAPGSLTPAQVRALYAAANLPDPVVSTSCHTLAEVAAARDSAASLILFGPVFEKVVVDESIAGNRVLSQSVAPSVVDRKISLGTGLDLLRAACLAAAPIPVLALGGISEENTAACIAAGAAGIAAIRLFLWTSTTSPVDLDRASPYA